MPPWWNLVYTQSLSLCAHRPDGNGIGGSSPLGGTAVVDSSFINAPVAELGIRIRFKIGRLR